MVLSSLHNFFGSVKDYWLHFVGVCLAGLCMFYALAVLFAPPTLVTITCTTPTDIIIFDKVRSGSVYWSNNYLAQTDNKSRTTRFLKEDRINCEITYHD